MTILFLIQGTLHSSIFFVLNTQLFGPTYKCKTRSCLLLLHSLTHRTYLLSVQSSRIAKHPKVKSGAILITIAFVYGSKNDLNGHF